MINSSTWWPAIFISLNKAIFISLNKAMHFIKFHIINTWLYHCFFLIPFITYNVLLKPGYLGVTWVKLELLVMGFRVHHSEEPHRASREDAHKLLLHHLVQSRCWYLEYIESAQISCYWDFECCGKYHSRRRVQHICSTVLTLCTEKGGWESYPMKERPVPKQRSLSCSCTGPALRGWKGGQWQIGATASRCGL